MPDARRRSRQPGVGVLLIEQFAHVALGLAQNGYVLEGGRIVYNGTAAELKANPDKLHSAYLLRERKDAAELLEDVDALTEARDPRAGRELGRLARRRRLGALPHRLARRRRA